MTPLTDEQINDIETCHQHCTVLSCDHDDIFVLIAEVRQARAELERLKKGNELLLAVIAKNPDMRHGEAV